MSQPITRSEVRALFNLWNNALKTGDPSKVADRYSREGTLLPTLSDTPRYDYAGIRDYFVGFLKKQPVGRILEGEILIGNNWAQDAGTFVYMCMHVSSSFSSSSNSCCRVFLVVLFW